MTIRQNKQLMKDPAYREAQAEEVRRWSRAKSKLEAAVNAMLEVYAERYDEARGDGCWLRDELVDALTRDGEFSYAALVVLRDVFEELP